MFIVTESRTRVERKELCCNWSVSPPGTVTSAIPASTRLCSDWLGGAERSHCTAGRSPELTRHCSTAVPPTCSRRSPLPWSVLLSTWTVVLWSGATAGSSTRGASTVRESCSLAVPARLVARQVRLPEWVSDRRGMFRMGPLATGFPLSSQDMAGRGLQIPHYITLLL